MRKGFSNLGEVLLVILVLAIGYLGGAVSTYELSDLGEDTQMVQTPTYNITCPEPQQDLRQADNLRSDGSQSNINNYIQASYTDVDYSVGDGEASVEVDAVAQPEGKSMRPTIFSGNTVLLQAYEGGEITEGEILRYETGDGYVIHRVQANYLETSDYLLMRGDNNEHSSRINVDQVTHRAVGILYTDSSSKYTNFQD
ncbi:hypothetical protein ACK3SF_03610 [Candidatus Nanosalina sp. VS9-1]|uniref:hypothetical protein n=1 Tax=Candidatus Nanosalina sp. VS9-1 TaxID=3388566 RepID=UPI0039E0AC7E